MEVSTICTVWEEKKSYMILKAGRQREEKKEYMKATAWRFCSQLQSTGGGALRGFSLFLMQFFFWGNLHKAWYERIMYSSHILLFFFTGYIFSFSDRERRQNEQETTKCLYDLLKVPKAEAVLCKDWIIYDKYFCCQISPNSCKGNGLRVRDRKVWIASPNLILKY